MSWYIVHCDVSETVILNLRDIQQDHIFAVTVAVVLADT